MASHVSSPTSTPTTATGTPGGRRWIEFDVRFDGNVTKTTITVDETYLGQYWEWQKLVETNDLKIYSWIGPYDSSYNQFTIYQKET